MLPMRMVVLTQLKLPFQYISLIANAGNPTSFGFGSNTTLNASGGSNYVWSPQQD